MNLDSLLNKRDEKPDPQIALVICFRVGDSRQAHILHGSQALMNDIDDGIGSRAANDSLGDPPGLGIWIWEGSMWAVPFEGSIEEVDYRGTWRRAQDEEVERLRTGGDFTFGAKIWQWKEEEGDAELG